MQSELEAIRKGATWQNIYDCLWTIATVRYVTRQQLAKYFPDAVWQKKIATKKKLDFLVQKGFLEEFSDGVLTATRKAVKLLKDYSDKNYRIIKLPKGTGKRDSVFNTDFLLQVMNSADFHAFLYPAFHEHTKADQSFLLPDAAVVFRKDNKARIIFLEIENPKPEWHSYLEKKAKNYDIIAGRRETWSVWWKEQCEKLEIKHCKEDEFGFQIWCFGKFKADWPGWVFVNEIS